MRLLILTLITLFFLSGCFHNESSDELEISGLETETGITVSNQPFTTSFYETLTPEEQYAISNKLLGTFYKGKKATEFFDLTKGTENLSLASTEDPIAETLLALNTPSDNYERIIQRANEKYYRDDNTNNTKYSHLSLPLAYIHELPLSSQMYDMWIAYQLTNTILFSPAEELDSTHYIDATTIFNNLFFWMQAGLSMREIAYLHMTSEENWRRFRSPEDNTREMMEIFLMRFNDEEVPKASTACKNWYLTDGDQDYQLVKTANFNLESQTLLDTDDIVSCEDFYREITEHGTFTTAVTRRIVDYMLPDTAVAEKEALTTIIVNTSPTQFRDIFTGIVFSTYYLTQTNKVKRFEETFFNLANRTDWYAGDGFFRDLVWDDSGRTSINLTHMNQRAMAYKLGRPLQAPVDTLSFAYYHAKIRDSLLLDQRTTTDPDNTTDSGWTANFINEESLDYLLEKEFMDYLFLAILSRKPTDNEVTELTKILETTSDGGIKKNVNNTHILLDYFSRLPELYMFQASK